MPLFPFYFCLGIAFLNIPANPILLSPGAKTKSLLQPIHSLSLDHPSRSLALKSNHKSIAKALVMVLVRRQATRQSGRAVLEAVGGVKD